MVGSLARGARELRSRARDVWLSLPRSPDGPPPTREARAFFRRGAERYTPILAAETEFGIICFSTRERGRKSHRLFRDLKVDTAVMDAAVAALDTLGRHPARQGRALVDVGAHIGLATIPAIVKHGFERAVAVEAEPDNFRLLRANMALNALDERVATMQVAVSDARGEAPFAVNPKLHGRHSLVDSWEATDAHSAGSVITVERITLDDLLERLGLSADALGLLKIDTNGHEPQVLRGARSVLESDVPVLAEYAPYVVADEYAAHVTSRLEERLDAFEKIVTTHYSSFLDMRSLVEESGTGELPLRPAATIGDLRLAEGGRRVTDLLLLK